MSRAIRTLLVISSTYPANSTEKVPRFVEDQVKAFCRIDKSISVIVVAPHNQASIRAKANERVSRIIEKRFHYFIPKYERLTDKGIMPALTTNKAYYLLVPFLMVGELIAIYKATKKHRPDAIYAHWFTPQAINASIVSKLTKTPFFFTTHASDVDVWRRFGWVGRKIVQKSSSDALAITSVSSRTADKLFQFFPPDTLQSIKMKTSIIPMGIHYSGKTISTQDPMTILFIGRLTEKKGLHYALIAFKELMDKFPMLQLVIAGDGELRQQLQDQANSLGIDKNVRFVGFVSGDEKIELLSKAEIMLVPSIVTDSGDAEGLPVSLMEGLANQMLCVATSVSGADDIMTDGVNGLLIEQRSPEAIVSAVKTLLTLSDPEKNKMKENAKKLAKKLDWQLIAQKHLQLFADALKNNIAD